MYFISEFINMWSKCQECDSELFIEKIDDSINYFNITIDSKCANCGKKWSHKFILEINERQSINDIQQIQP